MAKKSPNPTDKHVGSRVRMRRMMLSMSQEKLAAGLGLTFQQVQKYEKGTNRIGASRLQDISRILDVPVAFFFDGVASQLDGKRTQTDLTGDPAIVTTFFMQAHANELAEAYVKLETADRKIVVAIALALCK